MKRGPRQRKASKAAVPAETRPFRNLSEHLSWMIPAIIVIVTVVAFLPVWDNDFVNWDDDETLLENPRFRGLGWTELRWMFTTFHTGHYQPLSWLTFALDYALWGLAPRGYHLTNLLLHTANAVLFYFLAVRLMALSLSVWPAASGPVLRVGAALAALLFAIHPLRVESVAWATERRDVLSGLFFLGTLLCYLKAYSAEEKQLRPWWMVAAVAAYGLSLLSKAIGMTLPLVLLLLDVYPLGRLRVSPREWFNRGARSIWWEKVPFFVLALACAGAALAAQYQTGAMKAVAGHPLLNRVAQAVYGLSFYLWKTAWPLVLSPLYEIPVDFTPWKPSVLISAAIAVVLTAFFLRLRRVWPVGLAGWTYYLITLFPVLGFTQAGPQFVADRYSYLSCLPWALLVGGGVFHLLRVGSGGHTGRRTFASAATLGIVLFSGLGFLTWRQVGVWRNGETLWRHVAALSPDSKIARNNLGEILANKGKLDEAIENYQSALRIDAGYASAHNNLGLALANQGKADGAISHYHEALRINPDYAAAHYNLANALAGQGQLEEAVAHYREALRIDPGYASAHNNLGITLAARGETEEATAHFEKALQLDPGSAKVHVNLGHVLLTRGQLAEAVAHYRRAILIQPGIAEAHESLGRALMQQGRRDEAIRHMEEAVRIMKARSGAAAGR